MCSQSTVHLCLGTQSNPLGVCPSTLSPGGFLSACSHSPSQILSWPLCYLRHRGGSSPRIEQPGHPKEDGIWDEVLEPFGPDARGGGGAHRVPPSWKCWEPALSSQVDLWPRARTTAHSSSGCWDASREGILVLGSSQGNHPGILRTPGPSPHTSAGCRGWESSPGGGSRRTRQRLTRGEGLISSGRPAAKDPTQAPRSSRLLD